MHKLLIQKVKAFYSHSVFRGNHVDYIPCELFTTHNLCVYTQNNMCEKNKVSVYTCRYSNVAELGLEPRWCSGPKVHAIFKLAL